MKQVSEENPTSIIVKLMATQQKQFTVVLASFDSHCLFAAVEFSSYWNANHYVHYLKGAWLGDTVMLTIGNAPARLDFDFPPLFSTYFMPLGLSWCLECVANLVFFQIWRFSIPRYI